jgi:hypothetical protein
MKIVDSEVIRGREQGLIDAINASMDWSAIWDIFMKEHKLSIEEDAECKRGDIVVFDEQLAYRVDFEVKLPLSVLLDREGNYLLLTDSKNLDKPERAVAAGTAQEAWADPERQTLNEPSEPTEARSPGTEDEKEGSPDNFLMAYEGTTGKPSPSDGVEYP